MVRVGRYESPMHRNEAEWQRRNCFPRVPRKPGSDAMHPPLLRQGTLPREAIERDCLWHNLQKPEPSPMAND